MNQNSCLKTLLAFAVAFLLSHALPAQSGALSRAEMASDLQLLKQELQLRHPNLYTYSDSSAVEAWFAAQIAGLGDSLSQAEAFELVASFSEILQDGHSYVYPPQPHMDAFFQSAPLLPLDLFLDGNRLLVVADHSPADIPSGTRLLSINGVSVEALQARILPCIPRDGGNLQYPKHLFYKIFPAYYSYFHGFPAEFELVYDDGAEKTVRVKGMTRAEMRAAGRRRGIELEVDSAGRYAVLRIPAFDSGVLKGEYGQRFKVEVKRAFEVLAEEGVPNLAIDLRGNQGGELGNGVFLLRHVMREPFRCVRRFEGLRKGGVKRLGSRWDGWFEPVKQGHFDGRVFLFVNGGSFSCSAIVAATFARAERGLVLGSMTGGSAYVNSGGPNKQLALPASGILFTIPQTKYVLREEAEILGLGVKPDREVVDSAARHFGGSDPCLLELQKVLSTEAP